MINQERRCFTYKSLFTEALELQWNNSEGWRRQKVAIWQAKKARSQANSKQPRRTPCQTPGRPQASPKGDRSASIIAILTSLKTQLATLNGGTTLNLIPMVSIARLSVVKQSSFGLQGQYGRRVTRVNYWGFATATCEKWPATVQ